MARKLEQKNISSNAMETGAQEIMSAVERKKWFELLELKITEFFQLENRFKKERRVKKKKAKRNSDSVVAINYQFEVSSDAAVEADWPDGPEDTSANKKKIHPYDEKILISISEQSLVYWATGQSVDSVLLSVHACLELCYSLLLATPRFLLTTEEKDAGKSQLINKWKLKTGHGSKSINQLIEDLKLQANAEQPNGRK